MVGGTAAGLGVMLLGALCLFADPSAESGGIAVASWFPFFPALGFRRLLFFLVSLMVVSVVSDLAEASGDVRASYLFCVVVSGALPEAAGLAGCRGRCQPPLV